MSEAGGYMGWKQKALRSGKAGRPDRSGIAGRPKRKRP
jgi:hypothetical protein